MSKYGVFIGITEEIEIARFTEEQTKTYKDWHTAITGFIGAPVMGVLHHDVWLPEVGDPSKGMSVNIYGDPEALWDQGAPLNRTATAILNAIGVKSFLVGSVVILPATTNRIQGGIAIEGWERSDAVRAIELAKSQLFYYLKYNYKRRHEYGGAPSHPQLNGREG